MQDQKMLLAPVVNLTKKMQAARSANIAVLPVSFALHLRRIAALEKELRHAISKRPAPQPAASPQLLARQLQSCALQLELLVAVQQGHPTTAHG